MYKFMCGGCFFGKWDSKHYEPRSQMESCCHKNGTLDGSSAKLTQFFPSHLLDDVATNATKEMS